MISLRSHNKKGLTALTFALVTLAQLSLSAQQAGSHEDFSQEQEVVSDYIDESDQLYDETFAAEQGQAITPATEKYIKDIIVSGNNFVTSAAILYHIPYKVGELFNPRKTHKLIHNLYFNLKRFRHIKVMAEDVAPNAINLHIIVQEKRPLKEVLFKGNKAISTKDIQKKVDFSNIHAVDQEELKRFAQEIQKMYVERGYYKAEITPELLIEDEQATVVFNVKENKKALVKQVKFIGNTALTSKELRNVVFTREDWVLSFLDKSGVFHPDRLEADKHMIEQYYQNAGYLNAKVVDVLVDVEPRTQRMTITFEIEEGSIYTIKEVSAPGNDLLTEETLLANIFARPGQKYSRDVVMESIKRLEMLWGEFGYIFAHVEPSIQPDQDNNTVNIAFYTELGNKVYLNKLTIKGNRKTRDPIIRRRIGALEEGEIITQKKMDHAKDRVEGLGYFEERDGVALKTTRISENLADLDIIVKEAKTGHFNLKFGFGGAANNMSSSNAGVSASLELSDRNLLGSGIDMNINATWAKGESSFLFHLAEPWLFNRPISAAMDLYHRRPTYDEFRNTKPIHEKVTGGALTTGFLTRLPFIHETNVLFSWGIDSVHHERKPESLLREEPAKSEYQCILDREFAPGTFTSFATSVEQNRLSHPIHTTRGYKWQLLSKLAFPALGSDLGFFKINFEGSWFTPLINEFDLVLKLRGLIGIVKPLSRRVVPFVELYHMGGPATIRGFLFGQAGPTFKGDAIGSSKAIFASAELIFPITQDLNMKGVVFYDGGTGWDNPNKKCVISKNLLNNSFNYRHAVGVGIRMLSPMPVRVDWGFKLDPRRNRKNPELSESASEVHFSMSYDW